VTNIRACTCVNWSQPLLSSFFFSFWILSLNASSFSACAHDRDKAQVNLQSITTVMESSSNLPSLDVDVIIPFNLPERKCQDQHDTLLFGTLCSACEALDVDTLIAPAEINIVGELRSGIRLGTLRQLRDCSSHCPFCKVIVDQVPLVIGPEAVQREHFDYKEQHFEPWFRPIDHWKYSTRVPEPDDIILSLRSFRGDMEELQDLPMMKWEEYIEDPTATWLEILVHSGVSFGTPGEGMAIRCQKRLVPCLEGLIRKPLAGRIIPPQVRYSELRGQLDVCLQNHKECFLRDLKSDAVEKHFWLIDVVNKRVVLADQNAEYAVLSYVWGGKRAEYTHFKGFAKKNARIWPISRIVAANGRRGAKLPENLPATISDAVDFCRGLGTRFLWVDSICIDQESQEMKDYLIPRMDSIYMRAIVTIIAAAGEDANAGLPGVRSGTRKDDRTTVSLQGRKFITTYPPAKQLIAKSVWWKRAWTFQEGWLSPRCFIFTPQEVLFVCTQSTSRESLHSCRPRINNGLATRVFQTQEVGFPTGIGQAGNESGVSVLINGIRVGEENRVSSRLFTSIMRLYHRRQLTLEDDRIKAIQGCINIITEQSGVPSWCGMLMKWKSLAGALTWRHLEPSNRTNLQFPSYSWAGWDIEPVYFEELVDFYHGFSKIVELKSDTGLPNFSSGCLPLSFEGEVAQLHIKPFAGDHPWHFDGQKHAWCLDEQKHPNGVTSAFGECYLGELSAEEFQLISTGPSEFLGIAMGFAFPGRDQVVGMMIERKEEYVIRRTVISVTRRTWNMADRRRETLILL
jgi:hypothetical protein